MHIGHSLTSYSEGSLEDHGKQSRDDDHDTTCCIILRLNGQNVNY